MPEYSYNGWLASKNPADFGGLARIVVAGEEFAPGVRAGDVHTVLQYVAEQINARVEPVVRPEWHQADDWGYNYRINRNANNLSCHSSGTAIDYNATRHPNGSAGTFTPEQTRNIRAILAEAGGVVRWGGDFRGTKDEMHFEINANSAAVAAVAARIREGGQEDLDVNQNNKLNVLFDQVTGNGFKGWDENEIPKGPNLTLVDIGRRSLQLQRQTIGLLEVLAKKNAIDVDEQALAQAMLANLGPMLKQSLMEVMGADNQDLADSILAMMGQKLTQKEQ